MDNLKNKGPQDRSRISLSEEWERKYWMESLGVSEQKLREAISKVGNSAEQVKNHLRTKN